MVTTSTAKLKKTASEQKQALQTTLILTLKSELCSIQILHELCILNIYKLNIYISLNFIFKVKNDSVPDAFQNKSHLISHN